MKLAGPPAMMAVLLPTNKPAPMMPPMEIMVRCRPFNERLSSCLGWESTGGFGLIITALGVAARLQPAQEFNHRCADLIRPLLLGPVTATRQQDGGAQLRDEARQIRDHLLHARERHDQIQFAGEEERRHRDG